MSLLEEHATAHPPWRKAARLLFDLSAASGQGPRHGLELAVPAGAAGLDVPRHAVAARAAVSLLSLSCAGVRRRFC